MHVCFLSGEIFAFGKYGGFGRATRIIAAGLARRGIKVSAVVPLRGEQKPVEELDGFTVYGFPKYQPWKAASLCRRLAADIYHSQEPSTATWLAQRAAPGAKHVVTCRDTRDAQDWEVEQEHATISRMATRLTRLYEYGPLVSRAVQRADHVACAANVVGKKARTIYNLDRDPVFLPTPVHIPEPAKKSEAPEVCFLSRWDARKRPELFFELALKFPQVHFTAAGLAHRPDRDRALRARYGSIPNLKLKPLLNQFDDPAFADLLSRSWVFVNTALREGLPNSFLEAASYGCAILAGLDPDGFSSRFGCHVKDDDFASGLAYLLKDDRWREKGEQGRQFVKETFEEEQTLDLHMQVYNNLLGRA